MEIIMNIEQYSNYLVGEEKTNGENKDYDRCTYVWEHLYIPCYPTMEFWEKTEFKNNISRGKNIGQHKGYIKYIGNNFEVFISGDASFNFKGKYYNYYHKLIDKDYSGKARRKYLENLNNCKSMVYSLHNFAIMPQTGGMNKCKGACNDRLDKFLFLLDEYYKDPNRSVDNPIFSLAQGGWKGDSEHIRKEKKTLQKNRLKHFLDPIGSVYKYCEYFYLINDKDFIDCLIENGKTTIDSGCAVVAYMKLAEDFWRIRHEIINKLII